MNELRIFQVDAFTRRPFRGNPAAVVPIEDDWPADDVLQAIAGENNLSETAFFRQGPGPSDFHLRWFTPATEVDLCGHATLATAHVLFRHLAWPKDQVSFATRSGELVVGQGNDERLIMDFPALGREKVDISNEFVMALGRRPAELYNGHDLMAVFDNKRDVHELTPDLRALAMLPVRGVIATAPGAGHDFVSRFFAPRSGVPEDPVTGSAHCMMAPYWASVLNKRRLTAHQVSKRSGVMCCEVSEDGSRVRLEGFAVTIMEGTMMPAGALATGTV